MIKKFFLTLNRSQIEYMLISGQATVLYGAATFSEDIDLWVAPDTANWQKFIVSLQKLKAKVYKLTPPIKPEFIQKGHGFHFEFVPTGKEPVCFLDVMGVVPRVGIFQLEGGTDLRYIQELLGHKSWKITEIYTHLSQRDIGRIKSPLDFGGK